MHQRDECAVLRHFNVRAYCLVIWAGNLTEIVQTELVTTDPHRVADVHLHVFLILVTRDYSYSGNKDRHADVGQLHAIVSARRCSEAADKTQFTGATANSAPEVLKRCEGDPEREHQSQARAPLPPADNERK